MRRPLAGQQVLNVDNYVHEENTAFPHGSVLKVSLSHSLSLSLSRSLSLSFLSPSLSFVMYSVACNYSSFIPSHWAAALSPLSAPYRNPNEESSRQNDWARARVSLIKLLRLSSLSMQFATPRFSGGCS